MRLKYQWANYGPKKVKRKEKKKIGPTTGQKEKVSQLWAK
jgi:hypothetical protein